MKRFMGLHAVIFLFTTIVSIFSIFPDRAEAQGGQGQNAVYNASGSNAGSTAFIDASQFVGTDFCNVLNVVLRGSSYPPNGAVIDARAVPASTACANSPWFGISNPPPSTILLPAGKIVISATWVLPSSTHLIGEGDGVSPSTTTIQAASGFSGNMIQFGSSSCPAPGPVCSGISVEDLSLDGQGGSSVTGIMNQYSRDRTYVDHVGLFQILGTGLSIQGNATNSGPYTNIQFDTGTYSGLSSTVCVNINGLSSTRGIHGLTCISETNDAKAAVLLDSSNTSLEDIRIVGFFDGVLIGSNAAVQGDVLINVMGDTDAEPRITTPVNTVHISSANTNSDISIVGLSNAGGANTYSLQDDLTGLHLTDASVALYAIGEAQNNGYSRYTTSPNAAAWAVGNSYPVGGCTASTRGSLYSCTGGSGNCSNSVSTAALWVCGLSGGSPQWIAVR